MPILHKKLHVDDVVAYLYCVYSSCVFFRFSLQACAACCLTKYKKTVTFSHLLKHKLLVYCSPDMQLDRRTCTVGLRYHGNVTVAREQCHMPVFGQVNYCRRQRTVESKLATTALHVPSCALAIETVRNSVGDYDAYS